MLSRLGFLPVLVLSVLMGVSTARADKRIALIVGNSAYQNVAPLPNPVNDAEAIAGLLRNAGFDVVTSRNNLGNLDFKRSLREFTLAARDADIALMYFAGHGIEVKGTNYLVPVDAKLASDYDAEDEAVSLNRIIDAIEPARRLRVIILDACRDNPFSKTMQRTIGSRAVAAGLAKVEPSASNFLIAYAAKAGSTADDGKGVHSPFTAALLNHLGTPGLEVGKAFRQVRDEVLKNTRNRQEPFVYSSLGGEDLSLVPAAPAPVPAINMQAEVRHDYELAAQIGTKEVWEQFLAVYNTGFYATLARSALNKIIAEEARAAAASKAEAAAKTKAEVLARAAALKAEGEAKAKAEASAKAEAAAKERAQREQAAKAEAERNRLARDQEARDRQDRERLAQETAARDKAERVQAAKTEAERNRLAREQTDRDNAETKVTVLEPSAGQSPAGKHAIDEGALVKEVKKELKRVGCYEGAIDDNWKTPSTRASLGKFGKFASLSSVPKEPTADLLDAIRGKTERVCPIECGSREIEKNGRCIARNCLRGQTLDDHGNCRARQDSKTVSLPSDTRETAKSEAKTQGGVSSQCSIMRDKIGCTCAVQTGGYISGNRWYSPRGSASKDPYYRCLIAQGRQ